jgi:predicted DNA-binding transcriptional regulator YafY
MSYVIMGRTERIAYINSRLKNGIPLSVDMVVTLFEVSDKTVKRDIEYLRDRLEAPIKWNHANHSYEYSEPWDGLVFLDEHSLLAFAFLKAILSDLHYIPVVSDSLSEEFRNLIPDDYADIVDTVRYELPDMEAVSDALIAEICRSLRKRICLKIEYMNAHEERTERIIEPRRLINYSGKWYTVAFDHKASALRTFALSRIKFFKLDSEIFSSGITDESIELYVGSSYGIFKGEAIGTAVLRFYGGAASNIKNSVWHPSQIMKHFVHPVFGSSLELSLPVHDYSELLGRALRCGANCEVCSPPEFRDRWKKEIQKMMFLADA